jgi:hypothetical protein
MNKRFWSKSLFTLIQHAFPLFDCENPLKPMWSKLNENCTALLTIKVSAQIWLASVNSWRRSSSFTKCNIGQMDIDQRKQKSTVMNPPLPKKELHHVEWVWTKIYSQTVCSLTSMQEFAQNIHICSLPARYRRIVAVLSSINAELDKWKFDFNYYCHCCYGLSRSSDGLWGHLLAEGGG